MTHMPVVNVPPDWKPPAMLPGDEPGDWDRPACAGDDPYCPCQDGDPCHYLPLPGTLAAEIAKVRDALDDLEAEGHPLVRLWVWRLRRRLAQTERTIEDARDKALARYFRS